MPLGGQTGSVERHSLAQSVSFVRQFRPPSPAPSPERETIAQGESLLQVQREAVGRTTSNPTPGSSMTPGAFACASFACIASNMGISPVMSR